MDAKQHTLKDALAMIRSRKPALVDMKMEQVDPATKTTTMRQFEDTHELVCHLPAWVWRVLDKAADAVAGGQP